MLAMIDTLDYCDEVRVLATRLKDDWLLTESLEEDNKRMWVDPDVVYYHD